MKALDYIGALKAGNLDGRLNKIYGGNTEHYRKKYITAIEEFEKIYGKGLDIELFSVPGRSEISGNHTDHNRGKVLAAAVTVDIIAVASKNNEEICRLQSAGYSMDVVKISESAAPKESQKFKSSGLIAGICAGFEKWGFKTGGFNAYTTSTVLKGSGLSSSAAFEVMVGNILNHFYNDGKIENAVIAQISQFSENVYFGKPCGLMDQTACAVGGFVSIDFEDTSKPVIKPVDFDLSGAGYSICIVDTGGNHADLNEDYASVPAEMKKIAAYFGRDALRGITAEEIIQNIPLLRRAAGDRAILRALHFVAENKRVEVQTKALEAGDIEEFFRGVDASGNSSYKYLQNVYTTKNVEEQGLSLALCVTENITKGTGSHFRVHGGGFAGTIQAFIPHKYVENYKKVMDSVFGEGACLVLKVRPDGAVKI